MSYSLSTTSLSTMIRVENFGRLGRYDFVHLIPACHCSMVFASETQQVDIASPFVGGDLTLCDPFLL
jgi:hypothetical protein